MQAGELGRLAPVEVVSVRAHRVLGAAGEPEAEVEVTTHQGAFVARAGVPSVGRGPEAAEAGDEGGGEEVAEADTAEEGEPDAEGETPGGEGEEEVEEGGGEGEAEEEEATEVKAELTVEEEVDLAVDFLGAVLGPIVVGRDPRQQAALDKALTDAVQAHTDAGESQPKPPKFSAMVTLGLSVALCRAAAASGPGGVVGHVAQLAGNTRPVIPVPAFVLINGGSAGDNAQLNLRSVQIMPTGAGTFADAWKMGSSTFEALRGLVREQYAGDLLKVGATGGLVPSASGPEAVLSLVAEAVEAAECTGKLKLAVDAAGADLYDPENDSYRQNVTDEAGSRPTEDLTAHYETLCSDHGVVSIRDPFAAQSLESLAGLTAQGTSQVVVRTGGESSGAAAAAQLLEGKACSALSLQMRDLGTVSDALDVARQAQGTRCGLVISHPPGSVSDTFAADLAVGLSAGLADFGAPRAAGLLCDRLRTLEAEAVLPFAGAGYRFVEWA